MEKRGFTLIELLIAVTVLAVLTTAIIIAIDPASLSARSRDGIRKSDLHRLQIALEQYRADQDSYPSTATLSTCGGPLAAGGITYIQKIPCDPSGGPYTYTLSGSTYTLSACLESASDPDGVSDAACTATGKAVQYTSP